MFDRKITKKKKYIWLTIFLLYVLFIFSNSMKPADISSKDSGMALKLVSCFLESAGANSSWLTEHILRKAAHFSEYTLFGILLSGCVKVWGFEGKKCRSLYFTVGYIVPFCDETIQLFVKGRSGQISDVWLDCGGAAFGILVMMFLKMRYKRTEESNVKKLPNDFGI